MMKQLLPPLLLAVVVLVVLPRVGMFAAAFTIIAVLGWILVMLSILVRASALPAPVLSILDRLSPRRRLAGMQAAQEEAERQRLIASVNAAAVCAALDEALIGQSALTEETAQALESFVAKKNPSKPLSILVAGPGGSGRTGFAEAVGAALAPYRAGQLVRVDCASDGEIDLAAIDGKLRGFGLPVLLLDNVDRIGEQRHSGRIMADVARLLDGGAIDGHPLTRRCVVVLTTLLDAGNSTDVWRQAEQKPDETHLLMRHMVSSAGRMPQDLVGRIDLLWVLKPLEDLEQVAVVWKTFCAMAQREHEITIVEDVDGLSPGLEDFLLAARERWLKAGVSGVREAARFVSRVADDAFRQAGREGHVRVRARWDPVAMRIRLDPVADASGAPGAGTMPAAEHTPDGAPNPAHPRYEKMVLKPESGR